MLRSYRLGIVPTDITHDLGSWLTTRVNGSVRSAVSSGRSRGLRCHTDKSDGKLLQPLVRPPGPEMGKHSPTCPSRFLNQSLAKTALKSPRSPLNSVMNQVLKACQITMQSAALLKKEVSELRAENETKKRKRTQSRGQIASEESLSVLEASTLTMQPEQAVLTQIPREAESAPAPLQPRTRALPKCSICVIQGHKLTTFPMRTRF